MISAGTALFCIVLFVCLILGFVFFLNYIEKDSFDDACRTEYRKKTSGTSEDEDYDEYEEDEDEEEVERDEEEVCYREPFWVCFGCEQEFRIKSGKEPTYCPCCSSILYKTPPSNLDKETDAREYICRSCGEQWSMLDGDTAECCPVCGAEAP